MLGLFAHGNSFISAYVTFNFLSISFTYSKYSDVVMYNMEEFPDWEIVSVTVHECFLFDFCLYLLITLINFNLDFYKFK